MGYVLIKEQGSLEAILIVLPETNRFMDMIEREGAVGPPFLAGFSWRLIFGRPTRTLLTINHFQ